MVHSRWSLRLRSRWHRKGAAIKVRRESEWAWFVCEIHLLALRAGIRNAKVTRVFTSRTADLRSILSARSTHLYGYVQLRNRRFFDEFSASRSVVIAAGQMWLCIFRLRSLNARDGEETHAKHTYQAST